MSSLGNKQIGHLHHGNEFEKKRVMYRSTSIKSTNKTNEPIHRKPYKKKCALRRVYTFALYQHMLGHENEDQNSDAQRKSFLTRVLNLGRQTSET